MQKLVTHFSLRLGLELSGKENCIKFHPILWDCKSRNPQNLAGSVPKTPTSANILTQKKEQNSLLLKFVIPAGWSVSAPDAHRGHFFRLTLHSLMRFSTLKFRTKIYLIFSSSTADLVRYSLGKSICNCNRGIRDSNSTTLKFVILCEPIKDFILFSQPP